MSASVPPARARTGPIPGAAVVEWAGAVETEVHGERSTVGPCRGCYRTAGVLVARSVADAAEDWASAIREEAVRLQGKADGARTTVMAHRFGVTSELSNDGR